MATPKNTLDRRSFLKSSALAGGGMLLSFSWLANAQAADKLPASALPSE